jgi:hypothetical protein
MRSSPTPTVGSVLFAVRAQAPTCSSRRESRAASAAGASLGIRQCGGRYEDQLGRLLGRHRDGASDDWPGESFRGEPITLSGAGARALAVERDHADGLLETPNHAAGGGERRHHQRLLEASLKPAELTPTPFAWSRCPASVGTPVHHHIRAWAGQGPTAISADP